MVFQFCSFSVLKCVSCLPKFELVDDTLLFSFSVGVASVSTAAGVMIIDSVGLVSFWGLVGRDAVICLLTSAL